MSQTQTSRRDWRVAALCRLLAFVLLVEPQLSLAQSYQEGARKYTRGDIQGAETSLTLALRTTRAAGERAKIYKLLGITQFMQNKRGDAARSFQQALAANPSIRISKDEVLDESVVPFFESQRGAAKQAAAPRQAAPQRPAAPKPAPRAEARTEARPDSSPRFGKPINRTGVFIQSNARGAQVFIDGILAGNVGERIEASPGTTTVTLKAPGFKAKKFRIKVLANRENRYALNLAKVAPPKKAAPRAVARNERGGKKARATEPDLFGEEGTDGAAELAGRDLMKEFEAETAAQAAAPRRVPAPAPAPRPAAPVRAPAPVVVAEPPPAPALTAPAPAPAPQVPMAATNTPPPAPPNYSAPVYQAPPTYYAPQGYSAQQPVYYQQTPQGMVPVTPQQIQQGQATAPAPQPEYYAQEPAPPPAPPPLPRAEPAPRRERRSRSSSSSSGPNRFLLFLPLGVGQYVNGSTFLGLAMTGGQLGSLFFYFTSLQTADKAIANAQTVVASDDYTDEEKDQFVQDTEKFVRAQKANAQLGLLGFIALYGVGVIEANLSAPSGKPSRSRRADLGPYAPDLLPGETLDSVFVAEAVKEPGAVLRMGLIPNESEPGMAGFGLGLDWTF